MAWKPSALLLVLTTALALALSAPASAFDRSYISVGVFSSGPVKGLAILARTGAHRARVTVSLNGLEAGKSYVLGWYTKPCTKPVAAPAAKGGGEVAMEEITSFITRPIALSSMANVKSFRIWDKEHVLSCRAARSPAGWATVFQGPITGLGVVAAGNEGNAHAYISLHGLEADTDYRVLGSTRRCSRPYAPASRAFGFPDLHTAAHEAFLSFNFKKDKSTTVNSFRVLTRAPGGPPTQAACGITASYTDSGRVTY
jgi:hypothetical protein